MNRRNNVLDKKSEERFLAVKPTLRPFYLREYAYHRLKTIKFSAERSQAYQLELCRLRETIRELCCLGQVDEGVLTSIEGLNDATLPDRFNEAECEDIIHGLAYVVKGLKKSAFRHRDADRMFRFYYRKNPDFCEKAARGGWGDFTKNMRYLLMLFDPEKEGEAVFNERVA
jgi:hypothetical protein